MIEISDCPHPPPETRVSVWQMTRACLIHALHPEEDDSVILRVSYTKKGWMRVGVEAVWRVAGPTGGGEGDGAAQPKEERRTLSGWDRDMPAVRGKSFPPFC